MPGQVSLPKAIGLMAIFLLPALAATSFRQPIRHWGSSETLTLSVSLLMLACPATFYQKPPQRWFWLGFGLFGSVYLAISVVSPWREYLPTTSFLDQLYERSSRHPQSRDDDDFGESRRLASLHKESFRQAGHSALSLLIGLMGGTLAVLVIRSKRKNYEPNLPEGSLLKDGWRDADQL